VPDHPKVFFVNFVRRSYDDFLGEPSSEYLAKVAVGHANVMAERVWHWLHKTEPAKVFHPGDAGAHRRALAINVCRDFQLIWDVADGFKHVTLSRRGRRVTSADQTAVRGGAFDVAAFDRDAFDTKPTIFIELDDGTHRSLADVLANVIAMWEQIVKTQLQ
jgi:hypothetical protein